MSYNTKQAYQEYLKSDDWAWVQEQCKKRDKACQKCGKKYAPGERGFGVHHTSYQYVGAADINELESVILLCRHCHRIVHGLNPEPTKMAKIDTDLEKWFAEWDAGKR
jgi:predicted HNH restriction endonuclease